MHCLRSHGFQHAFVQSICLSHARHASLTSAIGRGIRKGANTLDKIGTSRRDTKKPVQPQPRSTAIPQSRYDLERASKPSQPPRRRWNKESEAQDRILHDAPQGVPYTIAGSEFLYGTFAVKAALEAGRRQVHRLYIWRGERSAGDEYDESLAKLARSKRIKIQEVAGSWDKMMMRMSGQRPHNGYVLEASPIPKLPISSLKAMETSADSLSVTVLPQSLEDQNVNRSFRVEQSTANISRTAGQSRYPLLLWLDRVTDTGNLGAIIRTASFFGVDGIIIPEHGTAPFSPITVKASAGTAEYVPILTVKRESDFVQSSKQNGWKFFAAVAPASESTRRRSENIQVSDVSEIIDRSPCVLMLGNEAEGLRSFLQKAADEPISIRGARVKSGILDSLNVSVAAALLVARFFEPVRKPTSTASLPTRKVQPTAEKDSDGMF